MLGGLGEVPRVGVEDSVVDPIGEAERGVVNRRGSADERRGRGSRPVAEGLLQEGSSVVPSADDLIAGLVRAVRKRLLRGASDPGRLGRDAPGEAVRDLAGVVLRGDAGAAELLRLGLDGDGRGALQLVDRCSHADLKRLRALAGILAGLGQLKVRAVDDIRQTVGALLGEGGHPRHLRVERGGLALHLPHGTVEVADGGLRTAREADGALDGVLPGLLPCRREALPRHQRDHAVGGLVLRALLRVGGAHLCGAHPGAEGHEAGHHGAQKCSAKDARHRPLRGVGQDHRRHAPLRLERGLRLRGSVARLRVEMERRASGVDVVHGHVAGGNHGRQGPRDRHEERAGAPAARDRHDVR
mmetsp:Transcript_19580/g.58713  ORF Transcript_19580/g.58713 Transcript_19580/m.58713 type:complete len:357 (+) Transcript_19580:694-1764(+)